MLGYDELYNIFKFCNCDTKISLLISYPKLLNYDIDLKLISTRICNSGYVKLYKYLLKNRYTNFTPPDNDDHIYIDYYKAKQVNKLSNAEYENNIIKMKKLFEKGITCTGYISTEGLVVITNDNIEMLKLMVKYNHISNKYMTKHAKSFEMLLYLHEELGYGIHKNQLNNNKIPKDYFNNKILKGEFYY